MYSIRVSVKDKKELLSLFLGLIGVGTGTLLLFFMADIYIVICEIVTGSTCEYKEHKYAPTWKSVALGMLVLVLLVSVFATFIILKRSINRPEAGIDAEVNRPEVEHAKRFSEPAVVPQPKPSATSHAAPTLNSVPTAPPCHPTTAHGAPVSQSTGPNVEVVSVEQGERQIKPLKQKEG